MTTLEQMRVSLVFTSVAMVLVATVAALVLVSNAPAQRAADQVWYWSPGQADAAIKVGHLTVENHRVNSSRCEGYGASTYSEDNVQLWSRFRCEIGAVWYTTTRRPGYFPVTDTKISKPYYVSVRATSRFTYVLTSPITGIVG